MIRDIVVIGGGPGGYVAAIRAAQLGAKVTLIEKEKLGGTCLNWGCIPTKALFKHAQILNTLQHSQAYCIDIEGYSIDFKKVQERKQKIVSKLTGGVEQLVKGNAIELIEGNACIIDNKTVEYVDKNGLKNRISTKNILIATGSKAAKPPIPGVELPGVLTSKELLSIREIPGRIAIIGGGVVGIEFASILRAFGAEVTVFEFMPEILPMLDGDIVKKLAASLKNRGIRIETGTKVKEIRKEAEGLKLYASGPKGDILETCDMILVSTGREMEVEGLNLDAAGVSYDRKGIRVDDGYRTSVPGIYAIGDVVGRMMLAHVASEEGKAAVELIMGKEAHVDYSIVPNCVFTFPEVSSVGITEGEAVSKGIPHIVSKYMFSGNGKALTMGEEEGMIKVIASADKMEILGVHIVGPHASDLIHEAVLAMKGMLSVDEIINTVHAHPTLAEALWEAVAGIDGRAIHMAPGRK